MPIWKKADLHFARFGACMAAGAFCISAGVFASMSGGANQGAIARTQAQSRPATQPAPDHSAPEKTWDSMCAAIKAGDLTAFRAGCFNRNEMATVFMDAYSDSVITTFQLAAAVAKLGEDGKQLSLKLESTYNDLKKVGDHRKLQIDGDKALWIDIQPGDTAADKIMFFRKVEGEWLLDTERSYALDTADGRKAAEAFMATSIPQLKLLKGVIVDIDAQKITTLEQMRDRLAAK